MDHKSYILNKLLDKYEESTHYYNKNSTNRRVLMNFTKKEYPQYDIEDVETKRLIHFILDDLKDKGVIDVEWYPSEFKNIVKRISLNLENIEVAYEEVQRKPKKEIVENGISKIYGAVQYVKSDWIKVFLKQSLDEIASKKKLSRHIPKDEELLDMLLDVLIGIDHKEDDEMLERVFSKKYLGDSKLFEKKLRSRIISIIDEYLLAHSEWDDDDILQRVGIVKSSEELLFYGTLTIDLLGNRIDFTHFCFGSSMNTNMIKTLVVEDLDVKTVITIENKANYLEYIKKDPTDILVIYLGGFYSPVKQLFLEKIYTYIMSKDYKTEFYHWGDIDYGGFSIFVQIRNNIIPKLRPLYMDLDTLNRYKDYASPLVGNDKKNLQRVLNNPDFQMFAELIQAMLKFDRKLEQEALLFNIED